MLCNSFNAESSGAGADACGTPENAATCPDWPNIAGVVIACDDAFCPLNGVVKENDGAPKLAAVAPPPKRAGVCVWGCDDDGVANAKLGADVAPKMLVDDVPVLAIPAPNKELDVVLVKDGRLDAPKREPLELLTAWKGSC